MKKFLKYFFLVMTVIYVGIILFSEDVRYELPSVLMFSVALLGFILTATTHSTRKVRV